jgi:hypothetical protein
MMRLLEPAVETEVDPQPLGEREHELAVGHLGTDVFGHPPCDRRPQAGDWRLQLQDGRMPSFTGQVRYLMVDPAKLLAARTTRTLNLGGGSVNNED